ncbi:HNH endonuclease signature motif containing protein [Pengzhenrongella sicca]|uniref:HNH endonuclease n=1 Tax=Pengzhenrongella sicca TaxID=2819238 RepID=A0A8A4ZD28_9MICO|nr:HNH endonuclease signature motif containing protein [Pengzhenrongella sicca]QTE29255.1 HNH endonuclease [Pengzhenrongella sicca]
MEGGIPQRAWLLMAAGDNRGHGGNSGYDDQFDAYYSWDSNVPNHKNLAVGDPIALWDKERLLGVSVIEEIKATLGLKLLSRCPSCNTTRISDRKKSEPRYRCMKCRAEFATPSPDVVEVLRYRARYDAAWTPLDGFFTGGEIRSLAVNAGDINAMRPLDWVAFGAALIARDAGHALDRVSARIDVNWQSEFGVLVEAPQGFSHALVRVRRGQQQFREQLLASQGSVCAFTGRAPVRVLEAGHLYSYAQLGTHFKHGGLMLRRDIHRLFDDGLLAVQPSRLRIDVAPGLAMYPQYARLHDEPLKSRLQDEQVDWLGKHWAEHRLSA